MQEPEDGGQIGEQAGGFRADQGQGDDAHGLLRVVHAVGEAHARCTDDLRLAEQAVDPARSGQSGQQATRRGHRGDDREQHAHQQEAGNEAEHGRTDHRHDHLPQHARAAPDRVGRLGPDDRLEVVASRGERRADQSADQRVRGRGRQSEPPGDQVPDDAAHERAQDQLRADLHHAHVDQARGDGLGDGGAGQCAQQVHAGGQGDGLHRREHLGRDHGGDGVGGVVEAVDVLEGECHQDHDDDQGQHRCGLRSS